MNNPLDALARLLVGLTALVISVCILAVFAKITWLLVAYIWTFGGG